MAGDHTPDPGGPPEPERERPGDDAGLPGLAGLPDDIDPADPTGGLGGLLASAQEALSAHARAAEQVVEGRAGGGVVTVTMTGAGEVQSVTLAPDVVDPDDIEMLQDLIVAALHDAAAQVADLQRRALGALGNIDLGGLGGFGDSGGLPGLGGGR